MEIIEGNIIDVHTHQICPGKIFVSNGKILKIKKSNQIYSTFISPGFIDAHVHIESSMLTPEHFSDLIISKGTLAIVNDPHEIANVMGERGVQFMIDNSRKARVKCFFGMPSCVPATPFDSAGEIISTETTERLAATGEFVCLSEMMDVSGVLNENPEVVQKIKIAKKYHLKIDGHAPLLSGEALKKYVQTGISTDHECSNLDEALEKIDVGMKILIREGSAAKNYNALKSLIASHPDSVMFCTDDAHPDEIIRNGHIDYLVRRALKDGFDLFTVLRIASLNPVKHYNLSVGTILVGENADFIRIRNLESFEVLEAYKDGRKVYEKGENLSPVTQDATDFSELNCFFQHKIDISDLRKEVVSKQNLCIEVTDGEIITSKSFFDSESGSNFESDIDRDILKIVYLNRYSFDKRPQVSWIKGIGLKKGAFATSIAHDSHNILAVGCSDSDIQEVINRLIENKGGLVVKNDSGLYMLELPIGGIMSDKNAWEVAKRYEFLTMELKNAGCRLSSPFMTLAFMSLIVIPELKIGEKGLFDFKSFRFLEEDKE
ncbi:MAG: adenine deaminase [Oscillibacter sp.]|nr:adenine deaminase [Oscillibacter sp.]